MAATESDTFWIEKLKNKDEIATRELWNRYFDRIKSLAKHLLSDQVKTVSDEEDLAISVFHRLCADAGDGKFENLSDRDDLWLILFTMTKRKAIDYLRRETRQKRGSGNVINETVMISKPSDDSDAGNLDEMLGDDPTPEFLMSAEEELQRLIDSLDDNELKNIAKWKMQGMLNKEISGLLAVSERTVERKLGIIRQIWLPEQ